MVEIQQASIMMLLSGIFTGIVFGFILQRGRYCMNSAFRDVVYINDTTLFKVWLLSLSIAIVGANLMEDMGLLGDFGLRRQSFNIIANMVGGYIFGVGMVMTGGCGSGVIYRMGEGYVSSLLAVLGFGLSLVATYHGPLKPVMDFLKGFKINIESGDEAVLNPALWDLIGGHDVKWAVIAVVAAFMMAYVLKGRLFAHKPKKGYLPGVTGILIGVIVIFALWASYYWGGQTRGLSVAGPMSEATLMFVMGDSMSRFDTMFNFWGVFKGTWSALYIIGIPVGAYISARGLSEYRLHTPPADELVRVFGGSLLMGFGAAVAGGCTIGHALTGMSTLALSSITTTIFIMLGCWTMVYFMFVKKSVV
ncbi:MAG: YeeE/YedE family protein [Dissulfurispiraceae bacterium]|nr:YeeE/YedE family protein [Dissulfurispiraceae bacterium]